MLEVASEPAPGHAVNVGPLGSKPLATELADQLTSLYRLRHCGRRLKLREHPSAYGQMGRCVSPCLGDLDPNAYRRQVDLALSHFERPGAGEALIAEIDQRMLEASQERRYERAAALLRRRERLAWVLERLEGVLRATHACAATRARRPPGQGPPRRVLARSRPARRLGPAARPLRDGRAHGRGAGARARAAPVVPVDEVDEIRIVASWVADHEPPELPLDPPPSAPALMRFVAETTETATAAPAPAPPRASGSRASARATSA